jgi:hypothetical protein
MVPEAGLEPAQAEARGILSPLCLPIPPLRQIIVTKKQYLKKMEATPGFEPGIMILQTIALPLGDVAITLINKNGAGDEIRTRDNHVGNVELYH